MKMNQQHHESDPLLPLFFRGGLEGLEFSVRAQGELDSVHRRELAALLIEAARSRLGLGASGHGNAEYGPLLEPVARRWEQRARRELQLLESDGLQFEGQVLVEMQLESAEKPIPELMILAALNLWSSPSGYLALGQVLLARGQGGRAREVYAELLRQDMDGDSCEGQDFSWRVREGLGAAWESLGSDRLALGCLRGAVAVRGAGGGPLVSAFFLALDLGRGDEALGYGVQLDQRFSVDSRRLAVCVQSLGTRIRRRRRLRSGGCWAPPRAAVAALEQLLSGGGSAARICQGLVGQGGDFGGLAS
ncbi:MAG: hypothetical protein OSB10_03310 [Planctomycetota bacterium]|nr:hypothetical protein [Planctomycetota bacterium]